MYRAELDWVVHKLRQLGVRPADLDDVAHEVFLVAYRRLDDFDRSRPARPWLFGIAYRVVAASRRSAKSRLEVLSDTVADATDGVDPRPRLEAHEQLAIVYAALDTLDGTRRAVLVMHDFDGFTIREVQGVIDEPANTLYSHLRRARRDFQRAVLALGLDAEECHERGR